MGPQHVLLILTFLLSVHLLDASSEAESGLENGHEAGCELAVALPPSFERNVGHYHTDGSSAYAAFAADLEFVERNTKPHFVSYAISGAAAVYVRSLGVFTPKEGIDEFGRAVYKHRKRLPRENEWLKILQVYNVALSVALSQMNTDNAVVVVDLLADASAIDPLFRPSRLAATIQAILNFCSREVVAAALEQLLPRIKKIVVLNLPPALQQQRLVLQQVLQIVSRTRLTPSERRSAQAAIMNLAELSSTCPLFGVAGTFSGDAPLFVEQSGRGETLLDFGRNAKQSRTDYDLKSPTPAEELHRWLEKEMEKRRSEAVEEESETAIDGACTSARDLYKDLLSEVIAQQLHIPLLHTSASGDSYFLKRFIAFPDMPSAYLPHSQKTLEGALEQRRVWDFLHRCAKRAFEEGRIVYLIDDS